MTLAVPLTVSDPSIRSAVVRLSNEFPELGSRSITANVVAPGFVDTDMTAVLTDEQKDTIRAQVPLGRYGTPEEVASAVLWLTGEGGGYVTGAVIPVDGGLGMGH